MAADHDAGAGERTGATGLSLNRRMFLGMVGAGGAAAATAGAVGSVPGWLDLPAGATPPPAVDPAYPHGIASGDPRPDGTVIWARVDPTADQGSGIDVHWEVAAEDTFASVLQSGDVHADATTDHTLHVTVTGLASDGWFHYRFSYVSGTGTHTSRVGRLRTAPPLDSSPDRLRFTFCSCQQINPSFYNAHAAMAAEDIDFVVHYGDYIYVNDGGTISVDDYRGVYKRFKANPYLQELHRVYPMVVMWDDGEFVNGIDSTMPEPRFSNARQAWFEFQPVDHHPDETYRTYREIVWGDLLSFLMLDVRQYRSVYIGTNDDTTLLPTTDTKLPSGAAIFDADRTALGAAQKAWVKDRLANSTQTWRHIGHGYPFVPLRLEDYDTPAIRKDPPPGFHVNGGKYVSTEDWDGYWAERKELMDFIIEECVPNVIATSGQTHIAFGAGIRPDYDDLEQSPVALWEFTCSSLTADPDPRSQYFPTLPTADAETAIHSLEKAFLEGNPSISYMDLLNQGYGVITVTPTEARCDFKIIDTFDADAVASTKKTFKIAVGALPDATSCEPKTPDPATSTPGSPGTGVAPAGGAQPIPGTATFTG